MIASRHLHRPFGAVSVTRTARWVVGCLAYLLAVRVLLAGSIGLLVSGTAVGVLYGIVAVGLVLVHRSHRVINFAVASIGAVPSVAALLLLSRHGLPYPIALAIAVGGGLTLGALVEVVVIRRFRSSPRLILTVATLGVSQALSFVALQVPGWLGSSGEQLARVPTPFRGTIVHDATGGPLVTGDQFVAVLVAAGLAGGLALFLRRSRYGIALRAAAENSERAVLLGVPVARVQTLAWAVAGLFGALTIFLRRPLFGVPVDGSLGPGILLFSLAAAAMARFDDLPVALVAGIGVGILEQASFAASGSANLAYALMVAVVLAALALRRGTVSRAQDAAQSTWQAVREHRPLPQAVARLPRIRAARAAAALAVAGIAIGAPYAVGPGDRGDLAAIVIFAIVAVSMVVLSGWGGQVSLGQFGLVAVGAAVGGGLAANHDVDLFVALAAATAAGALVATLLGLPALRLPGIYLAVVTLAFAAACEYYFLDPRYVLADVGVLPGGDAPRIRPPLLFGRIDLGDPLAFYFFTVAVLVLVVGVVRAVRRNRTGRVLLATRDNPRGAAAFGIDLVRTRLGAFATSGAIAGLAGALLAYQQQAVDPATYGVAPSLLVFLAVAIGGLTSLPGTIAAAVLIDGVRLFGDRHLFAGADLLVSGPGLLVVLLFAPGGLGQLLESARGRVVRWAT